MDWRLFLPASLDTVFSLIPTVHDCFKTSLYGHAMEVVKNWNTALDASWDAKHRMVDIYSLSWKYSKPKRVQVYSSFVFIGEVLYIVVVYFENNCSYFLKKKLIQLVHSRWKASKRAEIFLLWKNSVRENLKNSVRLQRVIDWYLILKLNASIENQFLKKTAVILQFFFCRKWMIEHSTGSFRTRTNFWQNRKRQKVLRGKHQTCGFGHLWVWIWTN